jgi:hypothetical protein
MRNYLTILFTFALVSAMLLPSVISLVSEDLIEICDFTEEEEKKEQKEKEFEKEKILYGSLTGAITNALLYKCYIPFDIEEDYQVAVLDINLPPPEMFC